MNGLSHIPQTASSVSSSTQKKVVVGKTYRLFDFHVHDQSPDESSSGSGSSSNDDDSNGGWRKRETTPSHFVIQMFGLDEKGNTVCLYIDDYQPFFFVKVDDDWTQAKVDLFTRIILGKKEMKHHTIEKAFLVDYHKLYGFSGGKKHKFIQFVFPNVASMNRMKGLWYESATTSTPPVVNGGDPQAAPKYASRKLKTFPFQGTQIEIYESSIPPLLRYFHIHNISPSGWVWVPVLKVRAVPSIARTTTCTDEYICRAKDVISRPEKETRVPYKICSFDIEADSSHGDFPLPIKTYKRLASNVVDVFGVHVAQRIDRERAGVLLRRLVLSAFGYDHFDDIDLVYPKTKPLKQKIQERIDKILHTPVSDSAKLVDDEEGDKSHLLKISTMFNAIIAQNAAAISGKEGNGNEGNGNEGNGNEGDDGSDGEDGDCEEPAKPTYTKRAEHKPSVIEPRNTVVDVLISTKYTRDEKVQITNDVFTRLFPQLQGDKVTFIGSTFLRYGDKEPYLNHCVVLGSCDPVAGVVVESVKTEREVLLRWANIIQTENPDIIIGYNIFGFDYEFLFRRAQEVGCVGEFMLLSRNQNELSAKEHDGEMSIEHTTVQLASGEYDLRYFKMTGRIQIDMYTYFRRDFNLSSYKLDDVAGQFISDDIKKVELWTDSSTGAQTTALFSANLSGLHVGDFIHIELSGFTSDYYKGGHKFRVLDIIMNHETDDADKSGNPVKTKTNVIVIDGHEPPLVSAKSVKWGMAKDDVSPQDIFRLTRGSSADRAIVAKYCIQDCNLVHHLMNKIDVITGYVEMSRICSVPISFLVFRGQGIKLTSYVAKKCRDKQTLMPDLEKSGENDGYEGAIVLPPKCSMYMDNPVACVDYSSLYPSSMISQNLSHDSKVWTKEYDLDGNLLKETGEREKRTNQYKYDNMPGYDYIDMEFDTYRYVRKTPTSRAEKVKSGKKVCRWAQFPDNRKGIMPSILEELLKARSDTRKKIKTESDPFMQNILDKRQLGYKVTANSLYGQCGAKTSTFYEKDVAASTTATGRMMIIYAKRIIEEVYGDMEYVTQCHGPVLTRAEYVYGDTDSVFFTFNLVDVNTGEKIRGQKALEMTIEIAQDAAQLCTQWLKPPMELSYEKTLMPFILLSKKRYVGVLYETDPRKGKLKYMGLSLKRRDSCDYLKDTYGGILNILMGKTVTDPTKPAIQNSIDFLNRSLSQLVDGKVPMEKLMITKALRSDYKNPDQIAHKVLADRIGKRDPGNKPKPGDRIKFVFVTNENRKALQGEKIETPEYIIHANLPVDYTHYITNQLMKPLQQLFGLAVDQIWENQGKMGALKTYRKELAQLLKEYPDDIETFMKKKEKLSSQKVKVLLFDQVLTQIHQTKHGIQTITGFFGKR
jgi:DNA polymerase elongation subunit (family B)